MYRQDVKLFPQKIHMQYKLSNGDKYYYRDLSNLYLQKTQEQVFFFHTDKASFIFYFLFS